jgi:hypothetical protein
MAFYEVVKVENKREGFSKCPYNKAHIVSSEKMIYHLQKCKEKIVITIIKEI